MRRRAAHPPAAEPRRSAPPVPDHDEWLLDEALEETFPASDPIRPAQPAKNEPRRTPRH